MAVVDKLQEKKEPGYELYLRKFKRDIETAEKELKIKHSPVGDFIAFNSASIIKKKPKKTVYMFDDSDSD